MATRSRQWGEGTITERPRADGTTAFLARWLDTSGISPKERAKTFPSRDAAEDFLKETHRAKRDGRLRSPATMTVSELVAEYIDRASSRISERTVLTYQDRAATMIAPTIGRRKLDTITPLDVQRWIDQLGKQAFAPSTIHAAVAVLMGALREAALLGITDRHLGQGIRRPSIGRPVTATWTEAEVKRVLKAVRDDARFGALYHVAIATGLRPGELRALKWADVDLESGAIHVRRTISKDAHGSEIIADRTKSKTSRAVAISPAIVARLKWHRARQRERQLQHESWQTLDLVFDRGDGHWLYQSHWQKFHRALCERVGVSVIRAHDLRHTSASLELETGTHPKIVSDRLGHSTIAMTMDRYSHVSVALQRSAANALSDRLMDDESVSEFESGT